MHDSLTKRAAQLAALAMLIRIGFAQLSDDLFRRELLSI